MWAEEEPYSKMRNPPFDKCDTLSDTMIADMKLKTHYRVLMKVLVVKNWIISDVAINHLFSLNLMLNILQIIYCTPFHLILFLIQI